MKKKPLISIITVNYNGQEFLPNFFRSIKKSTFKDYELIFVDNDSNDNSLQYVNENHTWVKVIKAGKNLGFAAGNNLGIKNASGKYLFFINNDTKLAPDCLHEIVAGIGNYRQPMIYACTLKSYDGKDFISLGNYSDILGYQTIQGKGKIFFADGTAFFTDKKLFEEVGGFDESFFMFNEDLDFCWRARIFGYQVCPIPKAIIYHKSGGTAVGGFAHQNQKYQTTVWRRYMGERNNLTSVIKNYSGGTLIWILPYYLIINILEIIVFCLHRDFGVAKEAYLKSWIWQLKNWHLIWGKHRQIQHKRKVKDLEIMKVMYKGSGKWLNFKKIGFPKFRKQNS